MKKRLLFLKAEEHIRDNGWRSIFSGCKRKVSVRRLLSDYLDALGVADGFYAYKGPNYAQIDLTNDCNNDCIGCWCNSPLLEEKKISPDIKKQVIPFKRVISLLDELHSLGSRHIYYAGGGEPFMHPEIMEILEYTKKKGFECYVNTNFTLVDEKKIREMARLGIDSLTVSVWAGRASVYAAVHPNKDESTFYRIKEMLKLLNMAKHKFPVIKIYNVIFNMNYQDIESMVEFSAETGSESVEFTVIDTIPGKTDQLLLSAQETGTLLESCRRLKEKYDNGQGNKLRLLGFEQFLRRLTDAKAGLAEYDSGAIGAHPCYAGWAFVRILADGSVNSCLKSHRFPVGNILRQSFKEVWNGPPQRYFRKKTFAMEKGDPFFSFIGNDPECRMGCYKSCDNMGHNMYLDAALKSMNRFENNILRGAANIMKLIR